MLWFIVLASAALAQCVYWALLHQGLTRAERAWSAPENTPEPLPAVSVIVAARNEEANLPPLLECLARQTHPRYEVLIVDDRSRDATASIASSWAAAHEHFRLVSVEAPRPPRKKHALTQGVAAARYDLLAFTDADCEPPPEWLSVLARYHASTSRPSVLAGYSPYIPRRGLLKRLARFETFVTGLYTAAAAALGRPYMAVGRNISYPKRLFERLGGFRHSLQSLSGDDDLFVQHAARYDAPVRAVLDPRTFVPTEAPDSWRAWLRQKRRHASAGRYYARDAQLHLVAFHTSDLACWLAPIVLGWIGGVLLASKLLIQGFTLYKASSTFKEEDLRRWLPLLVPCYTLYVSIVEPLGVLFMPRKW